MAASAARWAEASPAHGDAGHAPGGDRAASGQQQRLVRYGDVKDGVCVAPRLVRRVFAQRGWAEFEAVEPATPTSGRRRMPATLEAHAKRHAGAAWSLYWKSGRFTVQEYTTWKDGQRLNHFPGSGVICQKDTLARYMKRCRSTYGPLYAFCPTSFILPSEYTRFVEEYARVTERHGPNSVIWICKPSGLSRGRKIFLFRDIAELVYDQQFVVQRYVERPLLIGNYKFDLRLYVLVLSVHPLAVYLSTEGLARFSTEQYSDGKGGGLAHTGNLYAHLTNTSINKFNTANYHAQKDTVGSGAKWTLAALREHFAKEGWDWLTLWDKIRAMVVLTTLPLAGHVPRTASPACFEVLGFDVMIDDEMRPWLVEVNTSPALSCDCPEDAIVKEALLNDVIDAVEADPFVEAARDDAAEDERASQSIPHSRPPSGPTSLDGLSRYGAARRGAAPPPAPGGAERQRSASARLLARDPVPGNLVAMRVAARSRMKVAAEKPPSRLPVRPASSEGDGGGGAARPASRASGPGRGALAPRRLHVAKDRTRADLRRLRRQIGNLELIFPFNDASEELGAEVSLLSGGGKAAGGGGEPVDLIKHVVGEVKARWGNPASSDRAWMKRKAAGEEKQEQEEQEEQEAHRHLY